MFFQPFIQQLLQDKFGLSYPIGSSRVARNSCTAGLKSTLARSSHNHALLRSDNPDYWTFKLHLAM